MFRFSLHVPKGLAFAVRQCPRAPKGFALLGRRVHAPHVSAMAPAGIFQRQMSTRRKQRTQEQLMEAIRFRGDSKTGNVTLKQLIQFGRNPTKETIVRSAAFLHKELPVRLARRVIDLDRMPYGLCLMPSVRTVKQWYTRSFEELIDLPTPTTHDDAERVTRVLQVIYKRHEPTLVMMAKGLLELKNFVAEDFNELRTSGDQLHIQSAVPRTPKRLDDIEKLAENALSIDLSIYADLHDALDRFYMSRIGIRMLISQHLALVRDESTPRHYIGEICLRTSAVQCAHEAAEVARRMCEKQNLFAPDVNIEGRSDLHFPYVPSHLYYMLLELLKNSMRAVTEFSKDKDDLPPINIIIADGESNEDVTIKVSDLGGGIPRSQIKKISSYLYTTAPPSFLALANEIPDFDSNAPLAGLGYGLPIARLYARYFGGDLQVLSMEGHGTDAYLYINRLGNADEPVP